jgi:RNA polymerase sigma-70 factor (ECF subfamily)
MTRWLKVSPGVKQKATSQLSYAELSSLADDALMSHLRNGHHEALAVLCDRYHRLVLRVAFRILGDLGEAQDMMQSVFLEIFKSVAHFDQARGTTKIWILQCVYHRSFNRRRYLKLRGFYDYSEQLGANGKKNPAYANKNGLGELESARAVQQALGYLNKVQRNVLELAFFEGLNMHEIAQMTNQSFDSTRHHYYRGLEKLRSILCEVPGTAVKTSPEGGVAYVKS